MWSEPSPSPLPSPSPSVHQHDTPGLPTSITRHYNSLQEHAYHLEASTENGGLTPRHASRREGFTWGLQPDAEDETKRGRDPMPMETERPRSPPPLEEIIRRPTLFDADDLQNKLRHTDTMESQPGIMRQQTDSGASHSSDSYTRNNRRSSMAAFANAIARHVPDLKILAYPDKEAQINGQCRRDAPQDAAPIKLEKKDRVISFAPLPPLKAKESYDQASKPSVVVEEPTTPVEKIEKPANLQSQSKAQGGLRDRRKVNLDLSMPKEMPDLPPRGRSPVDIVGNLGAPRPRSPKTPWVRPEEPSWARGPIAKSTPIVEENYHRDDIAGPRNGGRGGLGLLPGNDTVLSSQYPEYERPPTRIRDRCYISRPKFKRSRSGRSWRSNQSAHSGSGSGSTAAQTPDSGWTTGEENMYQEQQARTRDALQQLDQHTSLNRSRRWQWRGRASSDEAPSQTSGPDGTGRRFSINIFKRSKPISDQTGTESKHTRKSGKPGKQPPTPSLAHMHVPPTFIPPGVHRVPTPPLFDAHGEVKGKLADFFFDVQGGATGAPRRGNKKPTSPGGYWDSDALLMSLTSDIEPDEEEEEEGPEGRRGGDTETRLNSETEARPGLVTVNSGSAVGYLGVKPPSSPVGTPMLGHDVWFRMHHDTDTPDERTLAMLARQEEEERRKFEWLVPEHLPNSPLCPLHAKYRGPSKGLCYWHGRRSGNEIRKGEYSRGWSSGSGSESLVGGSRGDYMSELGYIGTPTREVKRRRLVSLSSP
ncbi:hypothetical protein BDW02DRAFT_12314 [Decorospora gaudefroyi]|uniref:Uncharacterized protein n=1 Tax=Decorospora gaudefroyi TaxID=184978 RepID=A0A6A5KQF2_9PLEO|nr:hypothetical protein BDW02DRAFT_12314 [Decorospora gaudefroyi]